jgi:hypothetical protein
MSNRTIMGMKIYKILTVKERFNKVTGKINSNISIEELCRWENNQLTLLDREDSRRFGD